MTESTLGTLDIDIEYSAVTQLPDIREKVFIYSDISRMRRTLFDRLVASHGITSSQAAVLSQLFKEDNLTQTELAQRMYVGTVAVGGLVDRLEAMNLVRREVDPFDRRAKRVRLTASAPPIGKIIRKFQNEVDRITCGDIPADEIRRMYETLSKIQDNLDRALGRASKGDALESTK